MPNSDTIRFFRWGLPGWLAILALLVFVIADLISSPVADSRTPKVLGDVFAGSESGSAVVAALLAAGVGFPLGFMIYQFYFFMRWNSPFSRDGLIPPFIEGRWQDLERTLRDINVSELALGEEWRKDWINHPAFKTDHGFKWSYIEWFLTEALQRLDTCYDGMKLNERHRYLMDIMHFLGTSIASLYLGLIAYMIFKARVASFLISAHLIVLGILLVSLLTSMKREEQSRNQQHSHQNVNASGSNGTGSNESKAETDHPRRTSPIIRWELPRTICGLRELHINHLSFVFVSALGVVFLLVDPSLYVSSSGPNWLHIILRLGMIGLGTAVWARAVKEREERAGIVLCSAFTLLTSGTIVSLDRAVPDQVRFFDWSFMLPMVIFLAVHMVLVRNRQNARDDLIYLEYYTLRRCLTEHKSDGARIDQMG